MPIPVLVKNLPQVSCSGTSWYPRIVKRILQIKADFIFNLINPYIYGDKILDIGVGMGAIYQDLLRRGFDIKGIDVAHLSLVKEASPKLYNGRDMPFPDKNFDTALLIHVLHHCGENNLRVLHEAKRVAKRVIVLEDTYRNALEKAVIAFNDSIANFEFYKHPYYKTSWWREYVKKQGWRMVHVAEFSHFSYGFHYGRYVLFIIE